MPRTYMHLTTQDRAVVMTMRDDQCSIRYIAKRLCRSPGKISRELHRTPLYQITTAADILAKMDDAGTVSVVDSFAAVLNRQPASMRKTMTYDQDREMHGHKIRTERTGVQIYFADPHSP